MYESTIKKLPKNFVPYQQWVEYDLANSLLPHVRAKEAGIHPRGLRWGRWPIYFEEYFSDREPALNDPNSPPRLVIWHRLVRDDIPAGWRQLSKKASRLEGFATVTDMDYARHWSESARRYLRRWLTLQGQYAIKPVTLDEFLSSYARSGLPSWIKGNYAHILRQRARGPQARHLRLIAACDKSGIMAAGMAVIDSPTCFGSYYLCGFVTPEYSELPVMLGLMDHWYASSLERAITYLHFGEFWLPGKPEHWKGFSQFKAKFGLQYIEYPPVLMRPKGGTLWQ
jgi:hypothetical protein